MIPLLFWIIAYSLYSETNLSLRDLDQAILFQLMLLQSSKEETIPCWYKMIRLSSTLPLQTLLYKLFRLVIFRQIQAEYFQFCLNKISQWLRINHSTRTIVTLALSLTFSIQVFFHISIHAMEFHVFWIHHKSVWDLWR